MAYIGNQPTSAPFVTDTYTGTGSQTAFTNLSFAPAAPSAISVYVNGLYQTPASDYFVGGTTLNFVSAPAGSAEIVVLHLGVGASIVSTTSVSTFDAILTNKTTVTSSYEIEAGENGFSVGPITVSSGITVTVSSGQRWLVL